MSVQQALDELSDVELLLLGECFHRLLRSTRGEEFRVATYLACDIFPGLGLETSSFRGRAERLLARHPTPPEGCSQEVWELKLSLAAEAAGWAQAIETLSSRSDVDPAVLELLTPLLLPLQDLGEVLAFERTHGPYLPVLATLLAELPDLSAAELAATARDLVAPA